MGRNVTHERAKGQVKFFNSSGNYGFIKVFEPDHLDDVFYHISDYKADVIYEDWWMEFDVVKSSKGLKAVDLRRIPQPPEEELFGTDFNY